MNRNQKGFTPKELAYSLTMDWMRAMHQGATSDLDDDTPSFQRETRMQLAKLHNKLLVDSGLDGLPLGPVSVNSESTI